MSAIWDSEVIHPLGSAWRFWDKVQGSLPPDAPSPVVWFTTASTFEPTALCLFGPDGSPLTFPQIVARLDREEMGAWRIGVDPSRVPVMWEEYARTSGDAQVAGLESTARAMGSNLDLWRATFEPVRFEEWRRVEYYRSGGWLDGFPVMAGR